MFGRPTAVLRKGASRAGLAVRLDATSVGKKLDLGPFLQRCMTQRVQRAHEARQHARQVLVRGLRLQQKVDVTQQWRGQSIYEIGAASARAHGLLERQQPQALRPRRAIRKPGVGRQPDARAVGAG